MFILLINFRSLIYELSYVLNPRAETLIEVFSIWRQLADLKLTRIEENFKPVETSINLSQAIHADNHNIGDSVRIQGLHTNITNEDLNQKKFLWHSNIYPLYPRSRKLPKFTLNCTKFCLFVEKVTLTLLLHFYLLWQVFWTLISSPIDSTWSLDRPPVFACVRDRGSKQQTPNYAVVYFTGQSCVIGEPYQGSVV